MTASLLKVLLEYEHRVENDGVGFLTKDWNTFFSKGPLIDEEKTLAYSHANSLKSKSEK